MKKKQPGHNAPILPLPRFRGFHKHPLYFFQAPALFQLFLPHFCPPNEPIGWISVDLLSFGTTDNDFLVWRLCNNTPTRAEWKCKQAAWGEESSTCHEFLARQGWQRGERQRRGARKARTLQRLRWWLAARGRSSSPEKSTPSWSWDGEGCSSH